MADQEFLLSLKGALEEKELASGYIKSEHFAFRFQIQRTTIKGKKKKKNWLNVENKIFLEL